MRPETERLAALQTGDADDVRRWFTERGAVEIVEAFAEASDREILALAARPEVEESGMRAILGRFADFADADRLAQIEGSVGFELAREGRAIERHVARFSEGRVSLDDLDYSATDLAGADRIGSADEPDVVITCTMLDFVRLLTGQNNAALLFLSDRLRVRGEATLALEVGTVFAVPGTGRRAIDPTELDPEEVATAIHGTSAEHLREVMCGGYRDVVITEVFRRMPEFLDARKAARCHLVVGFSITGRADGGSDRYLVTVDHGTCVAIPDTQGTERDATVIIDGAGFLRLALGQLNPVKGLLTGAVKVRGDRAKALALNNVMKPPKARV